MVFVLIIPFCFNKYQKFQAISNINENVILENKRQLLFFKGRGAFFCTTDMFEDIGYWPNTVGNDVSQNIPR